MSQAILTPQKTTNLIINFDRDDWVLSDPNQTLTAAGLGALFAYLPQRKLTESSENEAEVSLYNAADYEAFKENVRLARLLAHVSSLRSAQPETKW